MHHTTLRLIAATILTGIVAVTTAAPVAAVSTAQTTATRLTYRTDTAVLADDPSTGRRVEVIGDVAGAEHVVVLVPGASTTLENFDGQEELRDGYRPYSLVGQARALHDELAEHSDRTTAVIAWLGYQPASDIGPEVYQHWRIDDGATDLAQLRTAIPARATVTWACHSIGTLVCAAAASSDTADRIVLLGSPGVRADTVADLRTSAEVWAGTSASDPIRFTPLLDIIGLGFGPDPAQPAFGARQIETDPDAGHSGYYTIGGPTFDAIARIALEPDPDDRSIS